MPCGGESAAERGSITAIRVVMQRSNMVGVAGSKPTRQLPGPTHRAVIDNYYFPVAQTKRAKRVRHPVGRVLDVFCFVVCRKNGRDGDRKSTRLNSSH